MSTNLNFDISLIASLWALFVSSTIPNSLNENWFSFTIHPRHKESGYLKTTIYFLKFCDRENVFMLQLMMIKYDSSVFDVHAIYILMYMPFGTRHVWLLLKLLFVKIIFYNAFYFHLFHLLVWLGPPPQPLLSKLSSRQFSNIVYFWILLQKKNIVWEQNVTKRTITNTSKWSGPCVNDSTYFV